MVAETEFWGRSRAEVGGGFHLESERKHSREEGALARRHDPLGTAPWGPEPGARASHRSRRTDPSNVELRPLVMEQEDTGQRTPARPRGLHRFTPSTENLARIRSNAKYK